MKKRILTYRAYMDGMLLKEDVENWSSIMEEHLQQLAFFQHERLVHLLVTITFALLEMCAMSMFVLTEVIGFGALAVAVFILLVPYIRHYYLLENEVQHMYVQYDKILEHIRKKG